MFSRRYIKYKQRFWIRIFRLLNSFQPYSVKEHYLVRRRTYLISTSRLSNAWVIEFPPSSYIDRSGNVDVVVTNSCSFPSITALSTKPLSSSAEKPVIAREKGNFWSNGGPTNILNVAREGDEGGLLLRS